MEQRKVAYKRCAICGADIENSEHPYSNKYCYKHGWKKEEEFRELQNNWALQDAQDDMVDCGDCYD